MQTLQSSANTLSFKEMTLGQKEVVAERSALGASEVSMARVAIVDFTMSTTNDKTGSLLYL